MDARQRIDHRWIKPLATLALLTGSAASAPAAPLSAHPIAVAVRHGDCSKAVALANAVSSDDGQAAFLVGRMLDEGICVKQNAETAARYFAYGAKLGDRAAALDYATKVGLGEGTDQSYERAGVICHDAGLDPQSKLSTYALGYACTLRGLAGRLLRQQLPSGAFRGDHALLVDFNPASAAMSIRSIPEVARAEAETGYARRRAVVDAPHEIEEAWEAAKSVAPKPDAARLVNQPLEMSLDIDMTLEVGRKLAQQDNAGDGIRTMQPGDLQAPVFLFSPSGH